MLEVIYDDLDKKQLFKDPDETRCMRPMQHKFAWTAPLLYAAPLAVMTQKDKKEQMDELAHQLGRYKVSLSSSLALAGEKLVEQQKEDRSYSSSVQTMISAIKSECSSAQNRQYSGYTLQATLWFYLYDHRQRGQEEAGWKTYPDPRSMGM